MQILEHEDGLLEYKTSPVIFPPVTSAVVSVPDNPRELGKFPWYGVVRSVGAKSGLSAKPAT